MGKITIFISYTHSDKIFTEDLAKDLVNAGAEVWFDEDLRFAQITPTIDRELRARRVFIFVLSRAALASEWCEREASWAYQHYLHDKSRIILVQLAESIEIIDLTQMWSYLLDFQRSATTEQTLLLLGLHLLGKEYFPESIHNAIEDCYKWQGCITGPLGVPEQVTARSGEPLQSFYGKPGYVRHFKHGMIYCTEQFGAFWLWGAIEQCYHQVKGPQSFLGFPTSNDLTALTSPQGIQGTYQCFEGGTIHWTQKHWAFPVWGHIGILYHQHGSGSYLGFPVTRELIAQASRKDVTGMYQRFEGPWNYSEEVPHNPNVPYGATIYWSPNYGAYATFSEIGERYERCEGTGGTLGFPTSEEKEASASPRGTQGRYQEFEDGNIYWHSEGGAHTIYGVISARFHSMGGTGSRCGFPASEEFDAITSPQGTSGCYQRFEGPWDYPDFPYGATIYRSPNYGAFETWGDIGERYELLGGTGSELGFPKSGEIEIISQRGTSGWYQSFEGGEIYWCEKAGPHAHAIFGQIYVYFQQSRDQLGFPMSDEIPAAVSPKNTTGVCQRFESSWDYSDTIKELFGNISCGATIYFSSQHGTYEVSGGIGQCYEKYHGTASHLGFPVSSEIDAASEKREGKVQHFEGGDIYWCWEYDSIPISDPILTFFNNEGGVGGHYGFPISEEIVNTNRQKEQSFEGGTITISQE